MFSSSEWCPRELVNSILMLPSPTAFWRHLAPSLLLCRISLDGLVSFGVQKSDSVLPAGTSGAIFPDSGGLSRLKSFHWKGKVATILILDEETDSRMLLKRVLELNGHQVTACSDAGQALAQAASRAFDLAILNITAGWSSLTRLPGLLRAADSKLKVMTIADHGAEKVSEGYPADALLFRPVDLEVIEAKVRELLLRDK